MKHRRRQGFSLLEVLLATAMLIGAAVVLMELASIGNRHAASARDLAKSQLLCQTKLDEILCGQAPAETVRPTPIEGDPRWVYSVDVLPAEQPGLVVVEVTTTFKPAERVERYRFSLVRWMRDPRGTGSPSGPSTTSAGPPAIAQGGLVP